MTRLALVLALLLSAAPAVAQDFMGTYYASIDTHDMHNSNGAPLANLAQMVQQDRANYHRFGRPGQFDQGDPWFGNADLRAQIPSMVRVLPGNEYIEGFLRRGESRHLMVQVYGRNGVPTRLDISEGAG